MPFHAISKHLSACLDDFRAELRHRQVLRTQEHHFASTEHREGLRLLQQEGAPRSLMTLFITKRQSDELPLLQVAQRATDPGF